jgi:RNA polymerase sigma-70 factor (ECF subfamily)
MSPTSTAPVSRVDLAGLLEQQRDRLHRVARRIVRDPHAAEDVVQEAALAALAALDRFEGRSATTTWLHRIVVNAALMHLRRSRHRREVGLGDKEATRAADADGPAALAELAEARAQLTLGLAELPQNQRNVIELRDIRGLDTFAAASVLGATPNAVKIRLHRARRALRSLLEGTLADAETRPIFALSRAAKAARAAG